ncbi:hypothetical protein [Spirosoma linguale]|uniref:Uncharacterized protein n=1 Tax=Spirosoma linguale (strain ATCC 33905 / DSM 74 / LMG 10896 / Claus 1) TaxID=504472 RepID=D2QUF6_SPILD|nr:hypothetical protein Slin_6481 [Spirosoma linguale DSM 74]
MSQPTTPVTAIDQLTQHLSAWLGADVIGRLRQNPDLALPYAQDAASDSHWMQQVLQTILSQSDIEIVVERLNLLTIDEQRPLLQQIEILRWQQLQQQQEAEKNRQQIADIQAGREQAELEAFRLKKELAGAFPTQEFIKLVFRLPDEQAINKLLDEAAQASISNLSEFLLVLVPAWQELREVVDARAEVPADALRQVHAGLSQFLNSLSGHYIPQRRAILDKVAQWASTQFTDYLFVSPEETQQVDPSIHNAHGLGGTVVREGRSFAVIRRQSRTVVIYADIIAD